MSEFEFEYLTNMRDNFNEITVYVGTYGYRIVFDEENNDVKNVSSR